MATLSYTPNVGYIGTDTLQVDTIDSLALTDSDTVAITVGDAGVTVTGTTVNEASPYVLFTVAANSGTSVNVTLALTSTGVGHGYATLTGAGTDVGPQLQYFSSGAWQDYTPSTPITIPGNGSVLVRTTVAHDAINEGAETLGLTVTTTSNAQVTGISTIYDDGTGSLYPDNTTGTPTASPAGSSLDDDRPLSVNSIVVNEASPYAVFTVSGAAGQYVKLALGNTSDTSDKDATLGTDTQDASPGYPLQYYNGTTWVDYVPGSYVQIPVAGTTLLVRTGITNDQDYEGAETFTLQATNTGGILNEGVATIKDDGTGSVFPNNTTGATDSTATLDDDRPLQVNSISVNEGSPYAVFTVTGAAAGQLVKLELGNTSTSNDHDATLGIDTTTTADGFALEYFDGVQWVDYDPGSYVAIPNGGTPLFVRTSIVNDATYEGPETFTLIGTNTGGKTAEGIGTIYDDGTGNIYPDNTTGTIDPTPVLNDDRTLTVNSITVNEASPYAVFTIAASKGESLTLDLAAGTATGAGTDYGSTGSDGKIALQYYDGTAWVDYTGAIRIAGTVGSGTASILVRTSIMNDTIPDNDETFTLTAAYTSGSTAKSATGTATIKDDGTGDIYKADGTTDPTAAKNNDITVSSPTVNEASPYVVFSVNVTSGQNLSLALTSVTATGGTTTPTDGTVDYGSTALQYSLDNGANWTNYTTAFNATLTGGATALLVRTTIVNDTTPDNGETFTLTATPTGGTAATGTATIKDDGTGDIFKADGTTDPTVAKNNDITVSSPTVNEASPYAVFTVSVTSGQNLALALSNGTATGGTTTPTNGSVDYGSTSLQYSLDNGQTWTSYTGAFDATLTGGATALLVRTTIVNDTTPDNGETFTLTATPTGGSGATGTATIKDDGTGDIYNGDGTKDLVSPKNNDITVSSPTVNEASPYAVFTVSVTSGQNLALALSNGTATGGTTTPTNGSVDYGSTSLQYSLDNGQTWTSYTGAFDATLTGGATALLVRTTIVNDTTPDNGETFTLTATPTGGSGATGTATIKDDGTGDIYNGDGTLNTSAAKDDDRALSATNDSNSVPENGTLSVSAASGLLANDHAAGSKTLSVDGFTVDGTTVSVAPGTPGTAVISGKGTLTIYSDGSYAFTPLTGYAGSVPPITYSVRDSNGQTGSATLSLNVVLLSPTAVADTFTTQAGRPIVIPVLSNDTRVAGTTLSITEIDGRPILPGIPVPVTGGTVTGNNDGTLTFTPASGYAGTPTFTYTIADQNGGTATATVSGSVVTPPPAPPPPPSMPPPAISSSSPVQPPPAAPVLTVTSNVSPPPGSSRSLISYTPNDPNAGVITRGFQAALGSRTADGSAALTVGKQINDVSMASGRLSFTVPQESFLHSDSNAVITLTATTLDNKALPSWITFDPVTGTFSGTPEPGSPNEIIVRVVAQDQSGQKAAQEFKIIVRPGQRSGLENPFVPKYAGTQQGYKSFSDQIRHAAWRASRI